MKVKFTIKLYWELDVPDRLMEDKDLPLTDKEKREFAVDHVSDIITPKVRKLPNYLRVNWCSINYTRTWK